MKRKPNRKSRGTGTGGKMKLGFENVRWHHSDCPISISYICSILLYMCGICSINQSVALSHALTHSHTHTVLLRDLLAYHSAYAQYLWRRITYTHRYLMPYMGATPDNTHTHTHIHMFLLSSLIVFSLSFTLAWVFLLFFLFLAFFFGNLFGLSLFDIRFHDGSGKISRENI